MFIPLAVFDLQVYNFVPTELHTWMVCAHPRNHIIGVTFLKHKKDRTSIFVLFLKCTRRIIKVLLYSIKW